MNDGNIEANPKLRMEPNPPHRTDKPHPELNGRYLFTLGRNPDSLSYGITADWMILDLSEAAIKDIDGKVPGFIDGNLVLQRGISRKGNPRGGIERRNELHQS